jgi:hypothetical protein
VTREADQSTPGKLALPQNGREQPCTEDSAVLISAQELQHRRAERVAERARRVALEGSVLNDPDVGRESGGP